MSGPSVQSGTSHSNINSSSGRGGVSAIGCSASGTQRRPQNGSDTRGITTPSVTAKHLPPLHCRCVSLFTKIEMVGKGTFGEVFKARERESGTYVALKKVLMENEKEGFPLTALREIKILRRLKHPNVVTMREVITSPPTEHTRNMGSIFMVFDWMDHDLAGLLKLPGSFSLPQIKCYTKQILEGTHYLHANKIMHRDMKCANLLVNNEGILKIADFGLARPVESKPVADRPPTIRVVTLWFRPPELLLGCSAYDYKIDVWGIGCIVAEMFMRRPLFPGASEIEQYNRIVDLCGTPSEETWPGVTELPDWAGFNQPGTPVKQSRLRSYFLDKNNPARASFPALDTVTVDFILKLLTMNPTGRPSANEALDDDFFWTKPLPCAPSSLPHYPSSHEYKTMQQQQQRRMKTNAVPDQSKHGGGQCRRGAGGHDGAIGHRGGVPPPPPPHQSHHQHQQRSFRPPPVAPPHRRIPGSGHRGAHHYHQHHSQHGHAQQKQQHYGNSGGGQQLSGAPNCGGSISGIGVSQDPLSRPTGPSHHRPSAQRPQHLKRPNESHGSLQLEKRPRIESGDNGAGAGASGGSSSGARRPHSLQT